MKKGQGSIDVVLVALFIVPVILMATIGSFSYFTTSAYNSNLNFDAGRYVASCGCSYDRLRNAFNSSRYTNYSVIYKDGYRNITLKSGSAGTITVNCPYNAEKGSEFTVETVVSSYAPLFPSSNYKRNFYVQEVK